MSIGGVSADLIYLCPGFEESDSSLGQPRRCPLLTRSTVYGLNEHTNGLVRQYVGKRETLRDIDGGD